MIPFMVGDRVRHQLGGLLMEVVGYGPPEEIVWCRWSNVNRKGEPIEGSTIGWFQADKLEKVTDNPPHA